MRVLLQVPQGGDLHLDALEEGLQALHTDAIDVLPHHASEEGPQALGVEILALAIGVVLHPCVEEAQGCIDLQLVVIVVVGVVP